MNKIQVVRKKYIYGINYYEVRLYTLTSEKRHIITSVLKTCSKSIAFKKATTLRTELFKQFEYIKEA